MKISRTWTGRLQRSQSLGARLGRPAVLGLAALAGLHLVWQFLFGSAVDVVGPARTVVNKSAVVSSFAQDFVSVWLTATANDAAVLTGFVAKNGEWKLPTTPAVVITAPTVVAVTLTDLAGKEADAEVYSVVVGVTQRPYESASPTRALYRVPVLWSRYGPQAISLPARVGGPGPGAMLPMTYPVALSGADPVFSAVSGFLTAYLTAAGGVDRYVSADSLLTGLGGAYQSVALSQLTATAAPPTVPADGESVRVLARVDAVTSQFAPTQLVYPLTLQGVGGRWVIAALDQAPAMSVDDDLAPAPARPQ